MVPRLLGLRKRKCSVRTLRNMLDTGGRRELLKKSVAIVVNRFPHPMHGASTTPDGLLIQK